MTARTIRTYDYVKLLDDIRDDYDYLLAKGFIRRKVLEDFFSRRGTARPPGYQPDPEKPRKTYTAEEEDTLLGKYPLRTPYRLCTHLLLITRVQIATSKAEVEFLQDELVSSKAHLKTCEEALTAREAAVTRCSNKLARVECAGGEALSKAQKELSSAKEALCAAEASVRDAESAVGALKRRISAEEGSLEVICGGARIMGDGKWVKMAERMFRLRAKRRAGGKQVIPEATTQVAISISEATTPSAVSAVTTPAAISKEAPESSTPGKAAVIIASDAQPEAVQGAEESAEVDAACEVNTSRDSDKAAPSRATALRHAKRTRPDVTPWPQAERSAQVETASKVNTSRDSDEAAPSATSVRKSVRRTLPHAPGTSGTLLAVAAPHDSEGSKGGRGARGGGSKEGPTKRRKRL